MQVSLAFDSDGGDVNHAVQYLDILHTRGVHTTFFLTGEFAAAHPDVVQRILAEGNEFGNYTVDHPNLANPPRTDAFICNEMV
jgi:chitooligosaccharide deacetylase